jgi:PqqD family protein of HPr-rel-A system
VPDPRELLWAHWDADSSLYHGGTGETHLLDALSCEVVESLCQRPLPLAQLSRLLAERCDTEDDPAWQQKIARILQHLHALHIIEKHPWSDSPTSPGRN